MKGSPLPLICPNGTYYNSHGAKECTICPEGFYCDPTEGPKGSVVNPKPCPRGYYCPVGTGYKQARPCPPGTMGPDEGYARVDQCQVRRSWKSL